MMKARKAGTEAPSRSFSEDPVYLVVPGFGRWAFAGTCAVVEGWPAPGEDWFVDLPGDVGTVIEILHAVLQASTFVAHPGWFQAAFEPVLAAGDETVCALNHGAGPLSPAVVLSGGIAQAVLMPYRLDDEEDEDAIEVVDGRGTPRKKA